MVKNGQGKAARVLLPAGVIPVIAFLVGSTFNTWYNSLNVVTLFTPLQKEVFYRTVVLFNLLVYPPLLFLWARHILSLRPLLAEGFNDPSKRLLRRVINLPWVGVGLAALGWGACAVTFPLALRLGSGELDPLILGHLLTSFAIAGSLTMTIAFFLIEVITQRKLYPLAFRTGSPIGVPGARPLSLPLRGLLGALATGVFPILSLLLLILAPHERSAAHSVFAIAVALAGILSGVFVAWLLSRIIVDPVHTLRDASIAVARGNLDTRIEMPRADEFGHVIEEFNTLISSLREKQELEENFGLHVGKAVAQRIRQTRGGVHAQEMDVTAVFLDIRGFTTRCDAESADDSVRTLNQFLDRMVAVVETHEGIVNKFLGDGLMALFGATTPDERHPAQAVAAGISFFDALRELNKELEKRKVEPLAIGVGIHTGNAVVGSIGSARRLEYTAIGDTVNVAARVQDMTKVTGYPLLITEKTLEHLDAETAGKFVALGEHAIRGKAEKIELFGFRS